MKSSKTAELAIWCPTYKRPHKLQEVATNIEQNTHSKFKLYWGCEPGDTESIEAAKATGHTVVINRGRMGYADTVQAMYEDSKEPIAFHANDDFYFPKDWDKPAMDYLKEHPETLVLGVHDGNSNTNFYTISFIRRSYIKELSGVIDMPNRVFYPYLHNFQDTEFSQTAIKRGVWASIPDACIEHRRLGNDETYTKNNNTYSADSETYYRRKNLFC